MVRPWILVASTVLLARVAKELDPLSARFVALSLMGFWSWYFFQLGSVLHAASSGGGDRAQRRFNMGLGFILLYAAIFIWFPSDEFLLNHYSPAEYGWRWVIFPLGLGLAYAVFRTLYLLSCWMSAYRGAQGFEEHWGSYMLLFWFFPIGIFVVQPRVVALVKHASPKPP